MFRLLSLICVLAIGAAIPAVGQETATPDPATTDPAAESAAPAEPAPLIDMQVTIVNQSGQMLMRFEVVPILGAQATTDGAAPAATDPAVTDPAVTAPPTEATATPDPRLSTGGELLKGAVVSAGNYGILTVPGGASVCTFRIVSTLQDGRSVDETVDICLNPIYTLLPPA